MPCHFYPRREYRRRVVGFRLERTGVALIATRVGAIVLSTPEAGACIVDFTITRKCSTKAANHAAVIQVARTKLNQVHGHESKAMINSKILG